MKKILAMALALVSLAMPASAEQPAADTYRQIFQSGTFYVEYSLRPYNIFERAKPGNDNPKEVQYGRIRTGNRQMAGAGGMFVRARANGMNWPFGTGITYQVANDGNDRIKSLFKKLGKKSMGIPFLPIDIKKDGGSYREPCVMHRDGNYYRFSSGNDWEWTGDDLKDRKDLQALVLAEKDMDAPELDLTEGWGAIRLELALPEEFVPFYPNDAYRDGSHRIASPTYAGSAKYTVGKQEYDGDAYSAGEKIYRALYKDGKLVIVQKYHLENGTEILAEELYVRNISGQLPEGAFRFSREIPVYAAGMGDVDDFLGVQVKVGTLGGAPHAS